MEQKNINKTIYKTPELTESLQLVQLLDDLRLATIRGNIEGVKSSLQKGIAVNQTLKGGWSPLMYACSMGHPEIAQYLLQEGANPNFHKELYTSLMAACASTRENEDKLVRCVELLLQYGADVNALERHRISALMFAAKEGHQKLVVKLVDSQSQCDLNLQDSQGWTALFWAVNQGKVRVVSILVQHGAKLNIKDRRGQSVLDLAQSKGLDDIMAILSNQSIPDDCIKVKDLETMSNLCSLKKRRESLFEALLDELMNAENNNGSIIEAEQVMSHAVRHLSTIIASISYVRLRVQAHPINTILEDKHARISELNTFTKKAIHQTQLLHDELKFLHQYGKKLEESDKVVPADLLIEKKESNNGKLVTFMIVTAAVVVAFFNNRFKISMLILGK